MFDIQNYYSFLSAIVLFQLLPGAGIIAILSATASHGKRAGMSAVSGILLGDFIYMTAAVLGLAAVLQKYPAVLHVGQYIGVFYLCYLGVCKVFARIDDAAIQGKKGKKYVRKRELFRQALFICLTNPKAIMFFMAFFPLFLTHKPHPATLAVMMLHVTIISLLYQTFLVVCGDSAGRLLGRWRYAKRVAVRLAGLALIGFGVKLARNIR